MSRGMDKSKIACAKLVHHGMTCRQYQYKKVSLMFGKALKIALVAIIPQLIRNFSRLLKGDKKRIKKVIEKFSRCVAFITIISTLPAVLYCYTSHFYGRTDRLSTTLCFFVGTLLAHMCESHSNQELYLGLNFPRAVGLVFSILENRGIITQTNFGALVMLMSVSGLYGLAQSREKKRNSKEE